MSMTSSPTIRNDRVITESGLMIEGIINTMVDPIHYDLNFYDKGSKVFSIEYPADMDVQADRPLKMDFITLCQKLIYTVDYIDRTTLVELFVVLGNEYYEWMIDNPEELLAIRKECEQILESNEGCEYYAKTRLF